MPVEKHDEKSKSGLFGRFFIFKKWMQSGEKVRKNTQKWLFLALNSLFYVEKWRVRDIALFLRDGYV